MIASLHYLTQDLEGISHQQQAKTACEHGIRWVQLRVKNKAYDEWLDIAKEVKEICDSYNSRLIINDNVGVAKSVDADGVHLGKNDMPIAEARGILGDLKLIGGTANNIDNIIRLQNEGVNYIGLGPYKFTNTKQNLSAILGIEGFREIIRNISVNVPIIAIGGIQPEDVEEILNTGVNGIAVSSAINLAVDVPKTIQAFIQAVSLKDRFRNH